MYILITLNKNYLDAARVMLSSLYAHNKDVRLFVLSKDLERDDFEEGRDIQVIRPRLNLDSALTTERYPEEMYYRLFAFSILPESVDKVLYLDPDIIVNRSLDELYATDLKDCYAAGCTHIRETLTKINALRIGAKDMKTYLNTGVLLLNLAKIREDFTESGIMDTIIENRYRLLLPDQDIMCLLFKDKILTLDTIRYNLSDRILALERMKGNKYLTLDYIRENTAIIHYCGKNKPWRDNYHGSLGVFYWEYKK